MSTTITTITTADRMTALRKTNAELERKLNAAAEQIRKTVDAWERGDDLTRRMHALRRTGGQARWSEDIIIERIQEWARRYGEAPVVMEWNPALAKRQGHEELIHEFLQDDWPHSSSVQRIFGSWNKAIAAAGFKPLDRSDAGRRRMRRQEGEQSSRWPEWHGWQLTAPFRQQAGMTQAEVAATAQLSLAWISSVEHGSDDPNPTIRALLAYAQAVGVQPAVLVAGEDEHGSLAR